MNLILIYIANPTKKEAVKIARFLLDKKLIACANIFPVASIYRWKGKIIREKECVLVAKTVSRNFSKIKRKVEKIHSYSVPCILKIPASANEKYFRWLKNEIK